MAVRNNNISHARCYVDVPQQRAEPKITKLYNCRKYVACCVAYLFLRLDLRVISPDTLLQDICEHPLSDIFLHQTYDLLESDKLIRHIGSFTIITLTSTVIEDTAAYLSAHIPPPGSIKPQNSRQSK